MLGEYDALSGLSQKAGIAVKSPVIEGGNGHGCGHNLLGVGALAAAIALRYYIKEINLTGTVLYYGCPAEETGFGKTYLVRENLFENVDFTINWHRDSGYIAVHMYRGMEYADYFAKVEEICRRNGGRPHWGKMHTMRAEQLRTVYPKWDAFLHLRQELDPSGVFLNPYLAEMLQQNEQAH